MFLTKSLIGLLCACPLEVVAASSSALLADATCGDGAGACALNALQSERKILSKRGVSRDQSEWPQKKLGNIFDITDDPETLLKVMNYQPGGSDKKSPTGKVMLPGIYWMDQYGTTQEHFGKPDMPPKDYPYYFPTSAPEVLFTTEGAHWVSSGTATPGTSPCLYPLAGGGVDENATWTYVNTNGKGWNFYWPLLNPPPAGWFAGDGPAPPPEPFNGYGLYFCPFNATDINIPLGNDLFSTAQMSKQPWGWDRITRCPICEQIPPLGWIGGWLQMLFNPASWGIFPPPNYARTMHYPLYQIIDGEGKATKHYQYFMDFINKKKSCFGKTFPPRRLQPSWLPSFLVPNLLGKQNFCNEGPGTMVYATNATWNLSSER